jgi:glucose-6-phosphate 1-dehydrogenase
MNNENKLPPTILVIFGITGDLSHRYLLPALNQVASADKLSNDFKIVGVSRREINTNELYEENVRSLEKYTLPLQMDLNSLSSYNDLKDKINEISQKFSNQPEVIYYLAVPPNGVLSIIKNLGEAGLNSPHSKLLLEKPFGIDLESARSLIEETKKHFTEEQIFRIDHYLAKEMAQNIVVFLGSNSIIRSIWNNNFIESIEIDAAEEIGIENRANFYDATGALRDIVQSHLLQLAALTLMDPCSNIFDYSELPIKRLNALKQLSVATDLQTVRGQYKNYKEEANNSESKTETFVSLILQSNDPRWQGVPIRLSTGKALNEKLTEIRVHFKKEDATKENMLILRLQPRGGIEMQLWIKQPGYDRQLQKLPLEFTYSQHFDNLPDAYEQVLVDAMKSNHSLFIGSDEVETSWEILKPLQQIWSQNSDDLVEYERGSTIENILMTSKN